MFERSRCRRCGQAMKAGWNYCPECGTPANPAPVFGDIGRQFNMMDGMKAFRFPGLDQARQGGISITIRQDGDSEPKIDVRTNGDYRKAEPRIRESVSPVKHRPPSGKVEEPAAELTKSASGVEVRIDLPGVKEKDIDVTKLQNSLEIRAYSGDKTYFKLIPIPKGAEIAGQEFRDGKLKLTISR